MGLCEPSDCGRNARFGVVRGEACRRGELPLRRDAPAEPLQRDAVEELRPRVRAPRRAGERGQFLGRAQPRDRGRRAEARREGRQPGDRQARMEQVGGVDRCRGIGLRRLGDPPGGNGIGGPPGPVVREPEMELGRRALRRRDDELLQPVEAGVRPPGEGRADPRVERAVAVEDPRCRRALSTVVEHARPAQRRRLWIGAEAEVEQERRKSLPGLRHADRTALLTARLQEGDSDRRAGRGAGRDDDDHGHARAWGHRPRLAAPPIAIFRIAMTTYRELLQQVKSEIDEVDATEGRVLLESDRPPLFVDVRERDEWVEGFIPGAVHVPRGNLESRIETTVPDREREIVLYCAGGSRSAFAAKTLQDLGYEKISSLAGGFTDWKRNGFPIDLPRALDEDKRRRYSRHLLIPEVGEAGQLKLLDSRILLIGAGGLGSPASLYLAAAGVGKLGIVDDDRVDDSNLQRQIVHSTQELGELKAESAKRTIEALNPDVEVVPYFERLSSENIDRVLADGWDLIVDGTDNFPTRYLVNDAAVFHGIPLVYGSIYRFEGQVSVFKPHEGPCYRCLFPEPPPAEMAPSCAEGGVLGVLPGIIGSLQANEALKLALGIGESLVGRLLLVDALTTEFDEVSIKRNPNCPVCGENPTITE